MVLPRSSFNLFSFTALGISAGLLGTFATIESVNYQNKALASPSLLEFRWDNSKNYKKLYYWQSSSERRDRSTYYLVIRPTDRRTATLKLKITFPEYFDAKISAKKLSLCKVSLGGMLARTRCLEKIPAVIEVADDQSSIEVFPNDPIPEDESYAVVMKIFNPDQSGMFQLNAMAQAPGDVPVTRYLGSWNFTID